VFNYITLSHEYQTPEDALDSVGFYVDEVHLDGELYRFAVKDDRAGKTSGWYAAFNEGIIFGDWRTLDGYRWYATDQAQWAREHPGTQTRTGLSQAELEALQKEYDQAREELRTYWEGLPQAPGLHPYFQTKKLLPDCPHIKVRPNGVLVVPAVDENAKFLTVQYIRQTDKTTFVKRWHKGLPVKGARINVGTLSTEADLIVVVEGIACALTMREAVPRVAAVCCFGMGNLLPVAMSVRARFPYKDIVILGDNDPPPGPGQKAAYHAATMSRSRVYIPPLPYKDVSDAYVTTAKPGEGPESAEGLITSFFTRADYTVEAKLLKIDETYKQDISSAAQALEKLRKQQSWTKSFLKEMREIVRRQYGKSSRSSEEQAKAARARQKEKQALQAQVEEVFRDVDPFDRLPDAFRALGVAGSIDPFVVGFISVTSRVLAASAYTRPSHLHLVGSSSVGKSFICDRILNLLPSEAIYVLNCGSPKVFVYDTESLVHKVIYVKEIDALPMGAESENDDGTNIVASALRELLTCGQCVYQYVQDGEVLSITREGPSSLICTGLIPLPEQLSTRAWTVSVLDDMETVREALRVTGAIEAGHFQPKVDQSFVQLQRRLQQGAPWKVVVPFAGDLADLISASPRAVRVMRDFSRLLTNIKAVTVLRYNKRASKEGVLQAELEDYATVFKYANPLFEVAGSGVDRETRALYEYVSNRAVQDPKAAIKASDVEAHFNWSRTTTGRRIDRAIKDGYLIDLLAESKGKTKNLSPGAPLPTTTGLPTPKELAKRIATPQEGTKEEPLDSTAEEVKGNGVDEDGLTQEGDLRASAQKQDPSEDSSEPRSDPDEGEFVTVWF